MKNISKGVKLAALALTLTFGATVLAASNTYATTTTTNCEYAGYIPLLGIPILPCTGTSITMNVDDTFENFYSFAQNDFNRKHFFEEHDLWRYLDFRDYDNNIIEIDQDNKLHAKAQGSTTITVQAVVDGLISDYDSLQNPSYIEVLVNQTPTTPTTDPDTPEPCPIEGQVQNDAGECVNPTTGPTDPTTNPDTPEPCPIEGQVQNDAGECIDPTTDPTDPTTNPDTPEPCPVEGQVRNEEGECIDPTNPTDPTDEPNGNPNDKPTDEPTDEPEEEPTDKPEKEPEGKIEETIAEEGGKGSKEGEKKETVIRPVAVVEEAKKTLPEEKVDLTPNTGRETKEEVASATASALPVILIIASSSLISAIYFAKKHSIKK